MNQCPRCAFNYPRYCRGRACDDCAMEGPGGCKCTTIKMDEPCPYFKEAKDNGATTDGPQADVVEVVRCKDCKHAWTHPCGYINCRRNSLVDHDMIFYPDDFCSYGERRSDTNGD